MNKQNSKHIKTIQKKNKQYDDGGNLLSTIGGTVGSTIGSAITTSLDDGRHTGIGDFLIGASPLAGTLAVQALNNKSNKKINKIDPYKTPDFVNAQDPYKDQEPVNYGAFGGQFLSSLGAGMASSLLMGGIGSLVNKAFGNNKQAINQRNARIQQAYKQAANISNINNYDDMANASIDTGFSVNRGEYGWFNGHQYRKDVEGANASKEYLASVIPNAANKINIQNELNLKQNYASFGGNLNTAGANFTTGMKHINKGDTHENNPYEGVPMGVDPQGTPNLVEEGETIYNDYVFSDRLKVPKQKIKKGQTKFTQEEKVLHKYEGKTYADAAKKAEKDSGVDERPNDNIAKRGFETILEILAQSQEQQRAEEGKEKMQQQLEALQEYLNSLPPEEREQIIQQIQQQLTGQEVPQQEIPQQVQQQGVPQDQQQMMQQQQQLSPEEIAMMQQQQPQQQEMSPEQQAMLQQQMQQQPPMEEQPMQEPQQQVQTQAYGGKLYEEGGQLSPEQMAMLQQQYGTPQQEVTPPTEPQSPQDLPPEYQGQEVPQSVEEVPQEGQQEPTQEVPQEIPQEQIEQSPAEMIDTNVNPEDMSTTELNKKIDEIIRYARDTQDKQLAREARKIKRKGTRTEKEEFVQETLEEIKEEQDQIRQDKAVKEENIKQQQAQQQQLAEEQAAQMQQQQQMPQEEQVPQEAMQQEEVPQEAVQADAGQALDAQEVPQEMQETPMMANGGKLYAEGGAINMGAVLAAIFEKNKNNPAMMSKFRRLQNCTDPQLQNDIAREIIELDRNSSYSCGGKLYADGGDISSQVAQAKNLYSQIVEKDPNITQLFNQMLSSITPDVATQIQKQYGVSSEDYAMFATVTQYMQQYQNNQAANGGRLFGKGGNTQESSYTSAPEISEDALELAKKLIRDNGIKTKNFDPKFEAYIKDIAAKIQQYLRGKNINISTASIKDLKGSNLLGTDGLNKNEARKTVLNNVNTYNQQQSLIGKGFKEGALDNNNTLPWYGYNSPVTVRDINPYKAFTATEYDGKQLYLDPDTGLVYNGVKEGYDPKTPFDINTNGKLYKGTYQDLADQGFYRTQNQNLDANPFIKESNYNIDKAKMDFVKYYNDKMFQFVAQSRGKADKKGEHVYEDKSGKLYYIDKSTKKKIYKTDNTSDLNEGQKNDEWRKVFLTGKELRAWENQLQNSKDEKEKFLANSIKKTWGPDLDWSEKAQWHLRHEKDENGKDYGLYSPNNSTGYLTETDEYLDDIDPRTGKPYRDSNRTSDNVNGKHHSGTFGVDNTIKTYWVNTGTAKNPKYKQVVLNEGININDYSPELIGQAKDANGWNIQRYLINDNKKRYAIKSGDKVYTIDADNFDPASVGLKTTTVVPYKDQNIPGLNGKTTWLEFDKDSKTDSTSPLFPFSSKVPLLAGIGLQAGTTIFNALKPTDYKNADALANLAATIGGTNITIDPQKIGDYRTFRPTDINSDANHTLAQANNTYRLLAGLSGGNRGTAAANILGNDYNTLVALGTNYLNAYEKNREQEEKVAQFNRETNKLNADWKMAADRANQDAYKDKLSLQANLDKDAINMRNTLETNKGNAISAGLTGLANLVYNLYQDDYNKKLQKYSIDMGNASPSTRYEYPKTSGAKGGKLRTRRKRTFNI